MLLLRHVRIRRQPFSFTHFELVVFYQVRKRIVPDFKCERGELPVSYVHGPDFADFAVLCVFRYLQDCLGFVVQLRTDVSSRVVIAFVQMQNRMDMQLVIA